MIAMAAPDNHQGQGLMMNSHIQVLFLVNMLLDVLPGTAVSYVADSRLSQNGLGHSTAVAASAKNNNGLLALKLFKSVGHFVEWDVYRGLDVSGLKFFCSAHVNEECSRLNEVVHKWLGLVLCYNYWEA